MTEQEAIRYIENYGWSTTRLGLERTKELLKGFGDPQKKLKFVHVAGSNGKGSTCAMLDQILRDAGYRTGLYISPYIQVFNERIRVNGENIGGEDLARITEKARSIADGMEDHPSQFELVTAIAMQYYYEQNCDIVVLEVGMGGALDSTNAIDAPEAAVITNIGLEHTEYLGNTLAEIAETKSGIIKTGCSAVCYDGAPEVTEVVKRVCAERGVPLTCVDFSALTLLSTGLEGQRFLWKGSEYHLSLLGAHQLHNAAVVLETVAALRQRGWEIPESAVGSGLAGTEWPARFEILAKEPLFILDGGHNPQCAEALAKSAADLLPGQKVVFLLGVLADKDYDKIIDLVAPLAEKFVCLTPVSDRALTGEKLAEHLTERGLAAEAAADIPAGIRAALSAGQTLSCPVICFGSLYLAGAVRTDFAGVYRKWLRKEKIRAREALNYELREEKSRQISANLLASPEFRRAKTIMVYRGVKGEVRLDALIGAPEAEDKRFCYPLCISKTEMIALVPGGEDGWRPGAFGIPEPVRELAEEVPPEEIDLVVCPLTGFDEACRRLGMGGGFYDRYLPKCVNAGIVAVAFECQKAKEVPTEAWDKPVDAVFTEDAVYRR